jgi:amino acid adenylation domain-containing protein
MAERGSVSQAQARCNAEAPVPGPDEHASAWEGHPTDPPRRMQAPQQGLSGDQASPDTIATRQDYPRGASVPQLVAAQAVATPDAVALVAQSGAARSVLTYRELDTWANQVAHRLRALGVGPDILVGLCLERSAALVVGALGILKAGGAYVPLDPAYPPERLAFMLHDAQTPVLVTQQRLAERLPAGPWRVVTLDGDGPQTARACPEPAAGAPAPAHLAYVIYTSGSTGQPKGVQITHDSLLNLVFWHRRAFTVTTADRATQLASPSFDATVWELWPYLTAGASVYLPDEETRSTPARLRDWLVAQGITISFLPTALAEGVMALEWPPQTALRILLTGADVLHHYPSPDLPFVVVNNYGPTECTVVATSGPVPPTAHVSGPARPPSIGRPIANTEVYILDDHLQPVPTGTPGELHIGGAGLARGYLNRPALTAEKFIPNPFSAQPGARLYKTGDRACFLPDGQIAFLGRIDDQIKIRGYRIEPHEIVAALNRHPAVQMSCVVAREDTPGDKRLVAYVVPTPGAQPAASALRAFLATQLPDYMLPTAFVWLEALPLTPNGKVDRAALPAPDAATTAGDGAFVAPRTPVEQRVAGIVAGLLGLEQIGMDDNFFLLGGHSLLGAQIIARVSDSFGVDLPLHTLYAAPTVAALAAEIERVVLATLDEMSDDEIQRLLG